MMSRSRTSSLSSRAGEHAPRTLDRREFSVLAALALLGGASITISACGGGGGSNPAAPSGGGGGTSTSQGVTGSISANHGHSAVITSAQLTAGNGLNLDIRGTATHTHNVELSSAEIVNIRGGGRVSKESSDTESHNHTVTFN